MGLEDVMHEVFFFQAEDGIRDYKVTGVQTCALPILILHNIIWANVIVMEKELKKMKLKNLNIIENQLKRDTQTPNLNLDIAMQMELEQIGRASCRERV